MFATTWFRCYSQLWLNDEVPLNVGQSRAKLAFFEVSNSCGVGENWLVIKLKHVQD